MNKKVVSILTAAALSFMLSACTQSDNNKNLSKDISKTSATSTMPANTSKTEASVTSPKVTSPEAQADASKPGPELEAKPTTDPADINTPSDGDITSSTSESTQMPDITPEPTPEQIQPPVQLPEPTPESTPAPTQKPSPTPAPTPAPTPTPKPSVDIKAMVDKILGEVTMGAMVDLNESKLKELYYIDPSLLKQFAVKMPMINVNATEFAIFEVNEVKDMDKIVEGIEKRVDMLKSQWEHYLPAQYELVRNYKVQKNGNYIIMVIAKEQEKIINIFNSYFK